MGEVIHSWLILVGIGTHIYWIILWVDWVKKQELRRHPKAPFFLFHPFKYQRWSRADLRRRQEEWDRKYRPS